MVSVRKAFAVGDHDFAKCSLIPSVALVCDITDDIGGSFFAGHVHVALKDSAFEASSPLCYTELSSVLSTEKLENPVLLMYSDGGPDHQVTFLMTKISL